MPIAQSILGLLTVLDWVLDRINPKDLTPEEKAAVQTRVQNSLDRWKALRAQDDGE